ncbi:hypothetical protein C4H01_RS24455 [Vibrio parahaemolyticus]|nr:hypothetical protein [Vibrio parahaemolyticus]EJG1052997.1 hypothetical protein [Vibrio parahaemolyticus]HBC3993250.1 hypothetical protein [Vibrio parahaemolyticus]
MTIKITEQKNIIVVRRWKYSAERKRSLPTTLYSVNKYSIPDKLPNETIEAHQVDAEEQQTFIDFVKNLEEESKKKSEKASLKLLRYNLNNAKGALLDSELKHELTLEQYEELSETINEIKKLITKNKNAIKRKSTQA